MGSNVLFRDSIYDGVVIKLGNNFSSISKLKNDTIIVGSSCSQKKFSNFAMENEISGFEFMSCIPGSIGGGLKMNSGCFGNEFKDNLISLQNLNFKEDKFDMLKSTLKSALVDTRAFEGCLSVDTFEDRSTNTIYLIEDWESLDHQAKYLNWRIETGLLEALDPILEGGSSSIKVALCGSKYNDI